MGERTAKVKRKKGNKRRNQFLLQNPGMPHIPLPHPPAACAGAHPCAAPPPPPIWAANVEYCCSNFSPPHPGQATAGELARTSFSNCFPHPSQRYS
jgi:hypothetical protein